MLVIRTKAQIDRIIVFLAVYLQQNKYFFNYQVFEIESCQKVGEFWVGRSVGKWLVDGWTVVGGFNKTPNNHLKISNPHLKMKPSNRRTFTVFINFYSDSTKFVKPTFDLVFSI